MKIIERIKSVKAILYVVPLILIIVIICMFFYKDKSSSFFKNSTGDSSSVQNANEGESIPTSELKNDTESDSSDAENTDSDNDPLSKFTAKDIPEKALCEDDILLSDIYAVEGQEVLFKCYRKDVKDYTFEIFNREKGDFESIKDSGMITDELGRNIAYAKVKPTNDDKKALIRCIFDKKDKDKGEMAVSDNSEIAFLHVLSSEISDLKVEAVKQNAGEYLSVMTIPVKATLKDGSEIEMTGLYGLYFCDITTADLKEGTDSFGLPVSVSTQVKNYGLYKKISEGEQGFLMEYRTLDNNPISVNGIACGIDDKAPVINDVSFNGFDITNEKKKDTKVTAVIDAKDSVTPYPLLKYAVKLKGSRVNDSDYNESPQFEFIAPKNGTYVVYCRDESGNVGTFEKELILSDTNKPVIDEIKLRDSDGWQKNNKIIVDAHDSNALTYCFSSSDSESSSGFIDKNEYDVSKNGTYRIEVKDSAGNVTEGQIVVSNIDSDGPVIKSITQEDEKNE